MSADTQPELTPLQSLSHAFLTRYPLDAARQFESLSADEAIDALAELPVAATARVIERLSPGVAESIIEKLPTEKAAAVIQVLEISTAIPMLARLRDGKTAELLAGMSAGVAAELQTLLEYPEDSVGRLMNPRIIAFNESLTVEQALTQLKQQGSKSVRHLFLLNDDLQLRSEVDVHRLVLANATDKLKALAMPIPAHVNALDPKEEVMEKLEKFHVDILPVVDIDFKLVGVIEGRGLLDALREDLVTDMQTMVGVSKDERALSSSFFAVRKRLPWLQINLMTAFLAASVVGMFEATIAEFTALAVLLPIAAGQSGNTGAQALAVTMRGLTLREITIRDWLRVMLKELAAGFINGIGIAVICGAGVYLWSDNVGLALVMMLAMVISMTIAGASGALVPILLKRFGQDPAQSSSIVLTTVTDIAGFMSFLGIATLLSGMLAS